MYMFPFPPRPLHLPCGGSLDFCPRMTVNTSWEAVAGCEKYLH